MAGRLINCGPGARPRDNSATEVRVQGNPHAHLRRLVRLRRVLVVGGPEVPGGVALGLAFR